MSKLKVILNSSEHLFNLSFSETLMLRNFARSNNLGFCSMIGGAESIRDIQEARNLYANAFEFNMIESPFAIYKICSAIEKVFKGNRVTINQLLVNVNISSPHGIQLINDVNSLKLPKGFKKSNFIFNLDRRSYAKILCNLSNEKFDYIDYEEKVNPKIIDDLIKLKNNHYKSSLSGGINEESIKKIYEKNIQPDYLKTGLFLIPLGGSAFHKLNKKVRSFQILEERLLNLMREKMYFRYNYLNERIDHLNNYLKENNS